MLATVGSNLNHFRKLAARRIGIEVHVAYSRPRPEEETGIDCDSEGRDVPAEHTESFGPVDYRAVRSTSGNQSRWARPPSGKLS